jgi:ketosteroid isomerase-like protein
MKILFSGLLVSFVAAGFCFGQTDSSAEKAILGILDLQKTAWNEGDIEEFMSYYKKSDTITFQSGNSRIHGWDRVLARYQKNYAPQNMGRLDFTDLSVCFLSEDSTYVLGRFKLMQEGSLREGLFTLVFKRQKEGWRIVHDHTSSE